MAVKEDVEKGENSVQEEIREPLLQQQKKNVAGEEDGLGDENHTHKSSKQQVWMVYLTTFVAVCGAFEVGACSGYSSPTQTAIMKDLDLSVAEVPVCVAEIAPKNLRGALTTINQIMLGAGVIVSYEMGTVITWRNLALTGLLPSHAVLCFSVSSSFQSLLDGW